MYTGFWWENLKERDCCEEVGLEARITLKDNIKILYRLFIQEKRNVFANYIT